MSKNKLLSNMKFPRDVEAFNTASKMITATDAALDCSEEELVHLQKEMEQAYQSSSKWFKVGRWVCVMTPIAGKKRVIAKIIAIDESSCKHALVSYTDTKGREHLTKCFINNLLPVRFRHYNYDDAKALIGKTIEYEFNDGSDRFAELITEVQVHGTMEILINGKEQSLLRLYRATINSYPFGVPEIDKEIIKETEQ